MPPAESALPLRHAVALGLLQGPAELLPISSSAHTTLIPWLAGWPYAQLDGELRKSFEVAVHAGAGAALAISMRHELLAEAALIDGRRLGVIALALAPPALAGYTLGKPIERRLGGPRSIAAGLLVGALAMAIADRRGRASGEVGRTRDSATAGDGLALGLAQAAALVPGISRNGATLAAARARGFDRRTAHALSWHTGLPVIFGASLLKATSMRDGAIPRQQRAAFAAGAASAFLSTLASATATRRVWRGESSLLPFALYRGLLAAIVISRLRPRDSRAQ
jgi:undecaprenyl-diphosphatase